MMNIYVIIYEYAMNLALVDNACCYSLLCCNSCSAKWLSHQFVVAEVCLCVNQKIG